MTNKEIDSIVSGTVEKYKTHGERWAYIAIGAYCLCLRADGNTGSTEMGRTLARLGGFVRRREPVTVGDSIRERLGEISKELERLGIPHTADRADELKKRLCSL